VWGKRVKCGVTMALRNWLAHCHQTIMEVNHHHNYCKTPARLVVSSVAAGFMRKVNRSLKAIKASRSEITWRPVSDLRPIAPSQFIVKLDQEGHMNWFAAIVHYTIFR